MSIGRTPHHHAELTHPTPDAPFKYLILDFIELTPAQGYNYCLVIVDMFSKISREFPSQKTGCTDSGQTIGQRSNPMMGNSKKCLLIQWYAFCEQSDLSEKLGFDLKRHCAYYPQSAGAIER